MDVRNTVVMTYMEYMKIAPLIKGKHLKITMGIVREKGKEWLSHMELDVVFKDQRQLYIVTERDNEIPIRFIRKIEFQNAN